MLCQLMPCSIPVTRGGKESQNPILKAQGNIVSYYYMVSWYLYLHMLSPHPYYKTHEGKDFYMATFII